MRVVLALIVIIVAVVGIVWFSAMKTGREIQEVKQQPHA